MKYLRMLLASPFIVLTGLSALMVVLIGGKHIDINHEDTD